MTDGLAPCTTEVRPVRELSLCTGIAGITLGLHLAISGIRAVCYCERESYPAATLVARMADKTLDEAPIWDNLVTFPGKDWRGAVDLVSAGFPCQPFSFAGKQKGTDDVRWLWPAIAKIIRDIQPRFVFLENTPGLVKHGLGWVLRDLAELGFDAEWDLFTATNIGAPHLRRRVFILAHSNRERLEEQWWPSAALAELRGSERGGVEVADSDAGREGVEGVEEEAGSRRGGSGGSSRGGDQPVADPMHDGRGLGGEAHDDNGRDDDGDVADGRASGSVGLWPPGPDESELWQRVLAVRPDLSPAVDNSVQGRHGVKTRALRARRDAAESPSQGVPVAELRGMVDGLSHRVDRLRCLGNSVVPPVVAYAWCVLAARAQRRQRCPGCLKKGVARYLDEGAVERAKLGKKITCMSCMKRFTAEDLGLE